MDQTYKCASGWEHWNADKLLCDTAADQCLRLTETQGDIHWKLKSVQFSNSIKYSSTLYSHCPPLMIDKSYLLIVTHRDLIRLSSVCEREVKLLLSFGVYDQPDIVETVFFLKKLKKKVTNFSEGSSKSALRGTQTSLEFLRYCVDWS